MKLTTEETVPDDVRKLVRRLAEEWDNFTPAMARFATDAILADRRARSTTTAPVGAEPVAWESEGKVGTLRATALHSTEEAAQNYVAEVGGTYRPLYASPAIRVTQELVTDLVRECERAMKQRDEALADASKRGPDGRTHDTAFEHIFRQHLERAALTPLPDTGEEPVAWVYELSRSINRDTGEYLNWGQPQVTLYKPQVPEGSIRNLRPLFASPQPASAEVKK